MVIIATLEAAGLGVADYDPATALIPDDGSPIDPSRRYAWVDLQVTQTPTSP